MNSSERTVTVKVGVFSHRVGNHTSVGIVKAIVDSFDKAPHVFLAESDTYQGTGMERLQLWKDLFSKRVTPVNLQTRRVAAKLLWPGKR